MNVPTRFSNWILLDIKIYTLDIYLSSERLQIFGIIIWQSLELIACECHSIVSFLIIIDLLILVCSFAFQEEIFWRYLKRILTSLVLLLNGIMQSLFILVFSVFSNRIDTNLHLAMETSFAYRFLLSFYFCCCFFYPCKLLHLYSVCVIFSIQVCTCWWPVLYLWRTLWSTWPYDPWSYWKLFYASVPWKVSLVRFWYQFIISSSSS